MANETECKSVLSFNTGTFNWFIYDILGICKN